MDTIIYLYRWGQPEQLKQVNYLREDFQLQDYHLIRAGMSEQLLQICQEHCLPEGGRRTLEPGGFFARRRRKRQLQQEEGLLAEFLKNIDAEKDTACFVCEETIPYFAGRCFNGYFEADWVRHMLWYGRCAGAPLHDAGSEGKFPAYFVILGQAYCVPEIVCDLVRSMKSLKWILPERQFREEQQELVDMLSEEYGLAVEVRLLSEKESYKQVYPVCRIPSLVLDFSEADRIPTADVARGSIWLDMASSEEKRRRIEDRDTGIAYFSLKKEWKQPQKALNYLDTIGKNGYNT